MIFHSQEEYFMYFILQEANMQAPQVISRIIIDDNHLHCRSCGQKIPIDSESRFCSDTCDKQQNYLKYLFYGEWLAFIVGSAYTLLGIIAIFFEFLDICSHNANCSYACTLTGIHV